MSELLDGQAVGNCEWCGEKDLPIYSDTKACESCDDELAYCGICNEHQREGDTCRHIFLDENYEWSGAGEWPTRSAHESFLLLLHAMPHAFLYDLKAAIESKKFRTFASLPMIGGGGSLHLQGMPDRDGRYMEYAWGDDLMDVGSGDQAEEAADGYHWLASLYKEDTGRANALTCAWIDEALRLRTDRQLRGAE